MKQLALIITSLGVLAGCGGDSSQTEACAQYVECIAARDTAAGITTNVDRFEASGDCWGSVEGQELCNASCENGLDYLASLENAPQECSP